MVQVKALQLFDEMQQQGFEPKDITNIAVSSASGKCRMPEKAVQLFDRCCSRGSSPTYHNCAVVSALSAGCRQDLAALLDAAVGTRAQLTNYTAGVSA